MTITLRTLLLRCLGVLSSLALLVAQPEIGQAAPQLGVVSLELSNTDLVPGSLLEVRYHTSPGTLQGPVDIYFALAVPNNPSLIFLQADGSLSTTGAPFRRNVTITEETARIFRGNLVWIPFGHYDCYMLLVQAGSSLDDLNAWVSGISVASFFFRPLSQEQLDLIQQRGNPDLLTTTWIDIQREKRDTWLYLTSPPTQYVFVNGALQGQTAVNVTSAGTPPKVDPALFTPQTTKDQLITAFGTPSSVENIGDTDAYQEVTFTLGLTATFHQGTLIAASTDTP